MSQEDQIREVIELLVEEKFEEVYQHYFSESLQKSMDLIELIQLWEAQTETSNLFVDMNILELSEAGSYVVAEVEVLYTDAQIGVRLTLSKERELVGLHIFTDDTVIHPDKIIEEEIVVGEGTSYELGGTLSIPKKNQRNLPAVILVHGSGPSDRDESAHAYKPFRDIAWGLAEQGIAVLRYDKRTFVHGNQMPVNEMKRMTVYEETVEDAILAGELLKDDDRIDSENIYIVGHSLGGMLAPRIAFEGGVFSGIISLAGSPRPLWEIIYDQNINTLAKVYDEEEKHKQTQLIEENYEKAQQIEKMTAEEALEETIFGISAYYFKEMDQYNAGELALALNIPILILQGENDFQVDVEQDFGSWQKILQQKKDVSFISYPGLNHFFVRYEGPNKGTLIEYNVSGTVDESVINDISGWILEHKE